MHKIELEIHPLTGYKAKPIGTINFTLPETWNELTDSQLIAIAPLYFQALSENQFKLQALACLIDNKILAYLDAEYIMQLFPCIEFLTGKIELTQQKFSGIYNNLVGPAPAFDNMTVAEYISADNHFREFLKNGSDESLNEFFACLFRPIQDKRDMTDRRKKYSALGTALYFGEVKKFKWGFKLAQVLWFAGCKADLPNYYPHLFPEPEEGAGKAGEEAEETNWASVLFHVAKQNVFGNFANLTENEYIHNIFSFLEQEFVEHEQSTRNTNNTEPS